MGNKQPTQNSPVTQESGSGKVKDSIDLDLFKDQLSKNSGRHFSIALIEADPKRDTTFDSDSKRAAAQTNFLDKSARNTFDVSHTDIKLIGSDRGLTHERKTLEFKAAVNLIGDRQKDHFSNLKHMKEQMLERDGGLGENSQSKQVNTNTDFNSRDAETNKKAKREKSPAKPAQFHTFYEANLFGFKLYQEEAYRQFQYTLKDVREDIFKESLTSHYNPSNIVFETIFNYKVDGLLAEEGSPILTVFSLPDKMKIPQKKIRLLALKAELVKFMRANPVIQEINFSAVSSKKIASTDTHTRMKNDFFEEFSIHVVSEIGFNSVVISRQAIKSGAQLSDHCTLVCPDVTSFQHKKIESLDVEFTDAVTVTLNMDSPAFDYFRLKSAQGTTYMVKTLQTNTLSQSWNPIFYMLQEFKIYSNHLYHKHQDNNVLGFKDYFLTSQGHHKFTSLCFVYDDFDCTLRDIMNDRQKSKVQFTIAEIVKIFTDIFKGLCALHKLGVVHRNLKPENVVYRKSKNQFMIANLSLALVFNKEESQCVSYDLVGTPFYMAIDSFSDLIVDNGKLKFSQDPFKADVYSAGVIMLECLWINIEINEGENMQLRKVFNQSHLKDLDDLLELCELKHREHNLFLSIFRKKPSAFKKLVDYDPIKALLENILFEEANARFDAYQAKNALTKIFSGDISSQAFNVDTISRKHTLDFMDRDNIGKSSLFLCLKNSLFLKDLNLGEQADSLDTVIETLWTPSLIQEYKEDYIQFIMARIKNLARLRRTKETLAIIEEQLSRYEIYSSDDAYVKLILECLMTKNDIMFKKSSVEEFFDANNKCKELVVNELIPKVSAAESSPIDCKLDYCVIVMNFWLFNENGDQSCITGVSNLLPQIKNILSTTGLDTDILIGCILMKAILQPWDIEGKLRMLKDIEDKITQTSRENSDCLIQMFLFQVYYLSLQGNNIPAFDYSKKVIKIISGNYEEQGLYELIGQMAPLLASINADNDANSSQVATLVNNFQQISREWMAENNNLMYLIIFFLSKLAEKFCTSEELKILYKCHIALLNSSDEDGYLAIVRPSIGLMELYIKELQFDQAYEVYNSIKDYLYTIETHCVDVERLYWLLQLQAKMLYEQGMYYQARLQLEDLLGKIISENMKGRFDSFLIQKIHTEISFMLMKCYIKLRSYETALPLAKHLLTQCDFSINDLGLRTKVVMASLRVLLNVDSRFVKDIEIVRHVNRVIEEFKSTVDTKSRIAILYFLAYHVYLKMRKVQKAKAALDDSTTAKLLSKEHIRKNQITLRLYLKRKQLKLYLKIWNQMQTDQKVVENIIKAIGSIVKKLAVSPSPYDKASTLKTFTIVAKAYLSLGMLDECLINLSKAIVSLNTFNVSGMLLLRSKIYLLYAKVHNLKGKPHEARLAGDKVIFEFKEFFGETCRRTKKVYAFMQRVCGEDEAMLGYKHYYDETDRDDDSDDDHLQKNTLEQESAPKKRTQSDMLMLPGQQGLELKELALSDAGDDVYIAPTPTNLSPLLRKNTSNKRGREKILISLEPEPSNELDHLGKSNSLGFG